MSKIHTVPQPEGRTWRYVSVQLNAGTQTIYTGTCVFGGVVVSNSLSANVCKINDGTVLVTAIAPSAPAGTVQIISPNGLEIKTRLVVEPEPGASGRVTVLWQTVNADKISAILRRQPGELELLEETPPELPPPPEPKRGSVFRRNR